MKSKLLLGLLTSLATISHVSAQSDSLTHYQISLINALDGTDIKQKEAIYISHGDSINPPLMPKLVAQVSRIPSHEGPPPPRTAEAPGENSLTWSLVVTYPIVKYKYPNSPLTKTVDFSTTISRDKQWNIYENFKGDAAFFGGVAVLTASDGVTTLERSFSILGSNPTMADASAYIKSRPNCPHYAYAVAKEESQATCKGRLYNQFYEYPVSKPPVSCRLKGYPGLNFSDNSVGSDGGYGIFQLTYSPLPTQLQLWNWQANADSGAERLASNRVVAEKWFEGMNRTYPVSSGYDPLPVQFFPPNTGVAITPVEAYYILMYNGFTASTNPMLSLLKADKVHHFQVPSCFRYDSSRTPGDRWVFCDSAHNYVAHVEAFMGGAL